MKPYIFGISSARWARRAAINTRRENRIPEKTIRMLIPRYDPRPARVIGCRLGSVDFVCRHCSIQFRCGHCDNGAFYVHSGSCFQIGLNRAKATSLRFATENKQRNPISDECHRMPELKCVASDDTDANPSGRDARRPFLQKLMCGSGESLLRARANCARPLLFDRRWQG